MESHCFRPCAELTPHVQQIWICEVDGPAEGAGCERIMPDGIVEAVFHYGDPFLSRFSGEGLELQPRSFVVSQTHRFLEIQPSGRSGFVSVRFYPWGVRHFLPTPVSAFADQIVGSQDVWGRWIAELEERISAAPTAKDKVQEVERFLLRQLRAHRKEDVRQLIRFVWNSRGSVSIRDTGRQLGVSERQLQRRFAAAVGASPRHYGRIARFLHTCRRIRQGGYESLTVLAQECGYYDQAHFSRECKSFSGLRPTQLGKHPALSFLTLS